MRSLLSFFVSFFLVFFQPTFGLALQVKGVQDSAWRENLRIRVPSNQLTNIGDKAVQIETGNGNLLADPGFERAFGTSPWSAVTWTGAPATINTTAANNHGDSLQSMKIDVTSDYSVAFLRQDVTLKGSFAGQLMEHGMWFKTTNLNLMQICARQNGARVGICFPYLNLTGDWEYQYATSVATSSTTSVGIELAGTGNMTGTGYADDAYVGPDRNSGSIRGEYKLGSIEFTGCSSNWTTTATSMSNFAAVSGCTITTKGLVLSPGSNIPGFKLNSIDAGTIRMEATSQFFRAAVAASTAVFRFSDGTNSTNNQGVPLGTTVDSGVPAILGSIDYSSAQTSPTTIQIQGFTNAASNAAGVGNGLHIDVYFIPNYATTVRSTNSMRAPTFTTLTSGSSATYTTPTGVSRLKIRAVGGGGGGGGCSMSSAFNGGTGGVGGNTTFGGLITATGGGAGGNGTVPTGGTGVLGTITAPAYGPTPLYSDGGAAGFNTGSGAIYASGGKGGASKLAGSAQGIGANAAGISSAANTGGGGDGASTNTGTGAASGSGGGAGAYVEATIDNPAATYTYTIGGGGTGGTAGTSCYAGGNGGSGVIYIEEIYGVNVPPMKAGVIAADNPGGVTTINTVVAKTSNYTATANDETIEMTGGNTLTLPPVAQFAGKKIIARQSDGNGQVTIDGNALETVCDQQTVKLTGKPDAMEFQVNAAKTGWTSTQCWKTASVRVGGATQGTDCPASSTCTLRNLNGSTWVSGATSNAGAAISLTLPSGVASGAGNCTCGAIDNGTAYRTCLASMDSATTVTISIGTGTTGTLSEGEASVICNFPR